MHRPGTIQASGLFESRRERTNDGMDELSGSAVVYHFSTIEGICLSRLYSYQLSRLSLGYRLQVKPAQRNLEAVYKCLTLAGDNINFVILKSCCLFLERDERIWLSTAQPKRQ